MSQEQEPVQSANASEELLAEIERLKSTNERLLEESKTYKTRKSELDKYKDELETFKQKQLEEQGNYQELLERERTRRREVESLMEQKNQMILKSNVFNAVSNYAKDAHDINDLLAQKSYSSMIEVDEETLEPIPETVQTFVDKLKAEKKYLFKGHKPASMADTKPDMNKPQPKTVKTMSAAERKEAMKANIAALFNNGE